jgi:uncharacterized damage-inducible protein DinB
MDEVRRIHDQLKRSLDGHAWHGPALEELLADVPASKAFCHPIPEAHSIWEIVLHISAWGEAAQRMLNGEDVGALDPCTDWPKVGRHSEEEWHRARGHLESVMRRLLEDVHDLTDEELLEIVPGHKYSVYFLLHGVVQHNIYHAGQIALLKKAAGC